MAKVPPRITPSRDEFYMGMAFWYASKSKDPATQVGAILVSAENTPLGYGYNGPPAAIKDTDINWDRPDKYPYVEHAEDNALDYSNGNRQGGTMYVTGKPCDRCARRMVKARLARVVYYVLGTDTKSMLHNDEIWVVAQDIAMKGGLKMEQFSVEHGNLNWMRDRMLWMEQAGIFKN